MAQLALTAAVGAASFTPAGGASAFIARTAAATAAGFVGQQLDRVLFGPRRNRVTVGPRLDDLQVQASTEGAPILRVYGHARVAGQVIWAANFKETVSETTQSSGGKGGPPAVETTVTEYLYSVSFAVGLCAGEIDRIGRVWADGEPVDLSGQTIRIYKGSESQTPDSAIEALEGEGAAPAFRGLAYVVFEDFALKPFGNRIPQLSFEVIRSLRAQDPGAAENALTGVAMIPGSGEFVYGTTPVQRTISEGVTESENVNNNMGSTDAVVSLDYLQDVAPNVKTVALVVSWFGDDLRCGVCEVRPGVETGAKTTTPALWSVGGVGRGGARLVSEIDGRPAYGGTPSDAVVVEAIKDLKARGLEVVFYPFILMDVPANNALTDPYTGSSGQPAYPWRGRITCDPAPGRVGTADKTAAAAAQVANLFGAAAVGDFSVSGESVSYGGPGEWSLRRMILHYAHLCQAAGGVDAFLIGSEMRGLTTIRAAGNAFPAVAAYKSLAADVRTVLGAGTKISYAADWSEYFGYHPADGTGDVFFHLDPLWSDAAIDAISIDNYMPVSDWRDGTTHADAQAGWRSIYDRDYLQANIAGGEGYDWFYASQSDRDAQIRTPITDGAVGKPWVFRYKDLRNWWQNAHYDRPGGVEEANPTGWVPQSKPFWFTEFGAPAVDKSTNQPNVFIDPKSAESALPYYSSGRRDDYLQRRYLEATIAYWEKTENNPASSAYSGSMVDVSKLLAYAWDARAYPDYPARDDVWGDTENWERGHWITGRLGRAPLGELVRVLSAEAGFEGVDVADLAGLIAGYVVDRPMSPRDAITPLMQAFQFDAAESGAAIRFASRGGAPSASIGRANLAEDGDADFSITRGQETDLPISVSLGYFDPLGDYRHAVSESRLLAGASERRADFEVAAMIEASEAQGASDALLADAWVMRETIAFSLPPSALALEPADVVTVSLNGRQADYRITAIEDSEGRRLEAVRTEASVYDRPTGPIRRRAPAPVPSYGPPVAAFLDLPLLRGDEVEHVPYFAAFARPWPGTVALYRSVSGGAQTRVGGASAPATL
ncbi:MAG: glycoside hydrolase/phage tail family protein, partial [Pseudomonadota bacterium]